MYVVIALDKYQRYYVWYYNTLEEAKARIEHKFCDLTFMPIAKELQA